MKRTASMSLDWKRDDEWDEWYANLPAIPGYYGTQTEGNAQVSVQPIGDGYGFDIFIIRTYDLGVAGEDHIHLDNRNFGIPDTDTAEEMMGIVEERLTIEDIADALQAEGYMPNVDVAASRKADKRTASMDLNWHEGMNGLPSADLPDIPGYPCKGGRHWPVNFDNISTIGTDEFLGYGFYISLRGAHHGATLEEHDFGFEPADTTEEVMWEVESLSPEEIADAAAAKGLEPVEED